MTLERERVRKYLKEFDLETLFVEELGWDYGGTNMEVAVEDEIYGLDAVAQKRGMVVYQYAAESDEAFPDRQTRQKIEQSIAKTVHEHLIVYTPRDRSVSYWEWVKRELGKSPRMRRHTHYPDQSGEGLFQKLEKLRFALEEEDELTIVDVAGRVRAAFDVEIVTKNFYEQFKKEHRTFLEFIKGIETKADREWYASLMLNRLMFIYFIQKRGFLNSDTNYLSNRLHRIQTKFGRNRFQTFYRIFMLRLFHEGLGQPEAERHPGLETLLGRVPYLNGGLFEVHDLERDNPDIQIPDEAFERIIAFFEKYQWHLDDRPLRNDNEINPDVLGYIFEKYINQKEMGAYYTKEDITGYISRNTIIPFLFYRAKIGCPIAFALGGGVWRLLTDDPDRYIPETVRHGVSYDVHRREVLPVERKLPLNIAAGLQNVAKRGDWNKLAPPQYGLPNETWREHIARRQHYKEVRSKLASGEIESIHELITYNLDIEKFTQDVIAWSEGPELVRAFWEGLSRVSILDPTCGSGAFLFAALNILEPIYTACLETMSCFLDDLHYSQRCHSPQAMSDFREILNEVNRHANERHFIFKSIIVNNLYGVDVMAEAVEICKLRLFLKLVAQLNYYEQLEPLPDIDFNITSGNTLIGFTTLKEIQRIFATSHDGQRKILYAKERIELRRIEEEAEIADRAFHRFREIQTKYGVSGKVVADLKSELRQQLEKLRTELDHYLASEYAIKRFDDKVYQKWHTSHKPFHWFLEFYGIMRDGGFDVVIGNPPYLEARQVSYSPRYFECGNGAAIHSLCIERSLKLCKEVGCISMIVPLALVSTQRMTILQRMLEKDRDCWYANFSWRPGKLFDTVNRALTIFMSAKADDDGSTYTTAYLKWNSKYRDLLIPTVRFTTCPRKRKSFWAPKLGQRIENSILLKVTFLPTAMTDFIGRSNHRVYYRSTGGLYWKVFTDFAPVFYVNGVAGSSSRQKTFSLVDRNHVTSAVAVLSSNLYWWWYTITSNLRDLNPSDIRCFPVPETAINDPMIQQMGVEYIEDLKANSAMLVRNQKSTGRTETQSFKVQKAKAVIDGVDRALAFHYGFSDEEIDFIINYDIKYRLGLV